MIVEYELFFIDTSDQFYILSNRSYLFIVAWQHNRIQAKCQGGLGIT